MRFVKGHGTGNDFVLYADELGRASANTAAIVATSDRYRGIGADGVIRAVRSKYAGIEARLLRECVSSGADWFMDYRNADGSVAEMCGNGVRVFVDFLIHEGLAEVAVGASIAVGTRAGVKDVLRLAAHEYQIDMGTWRLAYPERADDGYDTVVAAAGDAERRGLSLDLGNPHVVVALSRIEELEGIDLRSAPTLTPSPATRANVEYVVVDRVDATRGRLTMRVFERGVGETQSCGTGACAAALAVRFWAGVDAPDNWRVAVPGGVLDVAVTGDRVSLAGPSQLVAHGETDLLAR